MQNNFGQNMLIISSLFKGNPSFSLIPISDSCPYVEALFDPESKILAVISKIKKESLHMVPRLDDSGNIIPIKNGNKQQRLQIETFNEFYIIKKEEIIDFISKFAINSIDEYIKYFDASENADKTNSL